jgi:hypothetical protein
MARFPGGPGVSPWTLGQPFDFDLVSRLLERARE